MKAYSLICSLLEFEREQEDEVLGTGRGNIRILLAWRDLVVLVPSLFSGDIPVMRRAHLRRRAHH
jgi:hypothetical protein